MKIFFREKVIKANFELTDYDLTFSVLDRRLRIYYMFTDPSEVREIPFSDSLEEINERYELCLDGERIYWPSADPDLIEHYLHELIHRRTASVSD